MSRSLSLVQIVTPDVETWIQSQGCLCEGHHVDACLKTFMQFGQGHNITISQANMNDEYGPLRVAPWMLKNIFSNCDCCILKLYPLTRAGNSIVCKLISCFKLIFPGPRAVQWSWHRLCEHRPYYWITQIPTKHSKHWNMNFQKKVLIRVIFYLFLIYLPILIPSGTTFSATVYSKMSTRNLLVVS